VDKTRYYMDVDANGWKTYYAVKDDTVYVLCGENTLLIIGLKPDELKGWGVTEVECPGLNPLN